jgi:hypothetical protein
VKRYVYESGSCDLSYLFSAGLDTVRISRYSRGFLTEPTPTVESASAITSLFLALILFPRVQRRAQAELDAIIGRDRLPTFDDRPHLPYIGALCKELLRWKMVTPVGMTWGCYESGKVERQNDDFQVLPIRQVETAFTGVSSFRKVRHSYLTVYFRDLTINHWV